MKKQLLAQRIAAGVAASVLAVSAQQALAHQKGDFIVRSGAVVVQPNDHSTDLDIVNPALGVASGAKVGVDRDTQLGISFTYFVHDKVAVELLGATPFEHDVMAADAVSGLGKLGSTKQLPPTLSLQYYPLGGEGKFQPYVGVGVNYTIFFEEDTTPTMSTAVDALGAALGAPGLATSSTDLDLDDSIGLAAQVGFDFEITKNMGVNAAVWYADIDSSGEVTAQTAAGEVTSYVDVEIDPLVYMVGAYIKF